MSEKHIDSSNQKGLRHFSRHSSKCDVTSDKDCDYENRFVGESFTKNPPSFPKTGFGRHHILPVSSVGKFEIFDAYTESQRDMIRGVYKETKWCTSRQKNIIILPLKSTYTSNHDISGLDLPCHDVDHGCARGFTDEVTAHVEGRIWKKFRKAVDKKDHPQPKDVLDALEKLEADFREKLNARGKRKGGTAEALSALQPKGKTREEIEKGQLWLPFSMAIDPIAKKRVLLSLKETPTWLGEALKSRYPLR